MRPPNILDLVHAVTEMAPSHPEVEVWWYARTRELGAPAMLLVLETREGADPDPELIAAELRQRLGARAGAETAVIVRLHRGAAEQQALYRLLSTRRPAPAGPVTRGST